MPSCLAQDAWRKHNLPCPPRSGPLMRQILISLLAALPLTALAAPLPPALMLVQKQGGSVGQSFAAPDGLTGWVVTFPDRSLIFYTTVSGNYLISGLLVDQGGKDLTSQYQDRYFPKPDVSKLAE